MSLQLSSKRNSYQNVVLGGFNNQTMLYKPNVNYAAPCGCVLQCHFSEAIISNQGQTPFNTAEIYLPNVIAPALCHPYILNSRRWAPPTQYPPGALSLPVSFVASVINDRSTAYFTLPGDLAYTTLQIDGGAS